MATMKAVRIHRFGEADVVQVDEIETPVAGDGEILVRVRAASVNPVDYKIRRGQYPPVRQEMLPITQGRDFAGTVEALGKGVDGFRQGMVVYGMLPPERGAFAEFVAAKAAGTAPAPQGQDYVQAAAVPLAALTAWQGLFEHGGLKAGQHVLIHGGAGGVGHFAVQFAHAIGATVLATVSGQDADFARELGADRVIDYKVERFEDVARDIDLVYDLIAGQTQERSWSVLKEGGCLVSTLTEPSQEEAARRRVRALRYTARPDGAQLAEIARLVEQRKVRPVVDTTFPMAEAATAQDHLEKQHVRGKVVLTC
jgi:NADPH:quinone reductase-like Zn-dependent oxidoreductase